MWTTFKVLIECSTTLLLCYGGFLAKRHMGSQAGIKTAPPALEGRVLTPGPPAKSLRHSCLERRLCQNYAGVSLKGPGGYSADPRALLPEALTQ